MFEIMNTFADLLDNLCFGVVVIAIGCIVVGIVAGIIDAVNRWRGK